MLCHGNLISSSTNSKKKKVSIQQCGRADADMQSAFKLIMELVHGLSVKLATQTLIVLIIREIVTMCYCCKFYCFNQALLAL